jgi:type IV pilus assembly protein PilY1
MMHRRSFLAGLAAAAALAAAPAANGQFDPAGEDTDLFLVNPAASSARPNVLIMLDNTANWNQPFVAEKLALETVFRNVSEQFNVGLMMFPETGSPNDSTDGGYVRFAIRQMTTTNKNQLADLARDFDKLRDKGNNATFSLLMYEAYAYFAGIQARAGFGKVKRDFAGNTTYNPYAASLPGNAFVSASSQTYVSPIVDPCQKNFTILISNGPATDNSASLAAAQKLLEGLVGASPPQTIAISPSGSQNNWTDEYARYMANGDCNPNIAGIQNVFTYVIEVDPGTNLAARNHTALMKSSATNGKGRYYAVRSGTDGSEIVQALNEILQEALAINSVFASTTLPVSVNVRGTNANQVYMGVFRSDANRAPRWFGNLKLYQLGVDGTTSPPDLFLADAAGNRAESASTGFIVPSATSFWTHPSSFWAFRPAFDPADFGKASDAPDGPIVEKGGIGQGIRERDPASRALFTCTTGCLPGSPLADTPFSSANADITAAALGVDPTRRAEIIDWVRGLDLDDENANGSTIDARSTGHGDVLHSRPAVVNYNRAGLNDDNDVFVFYGANDGVFRAIQGGFAAGAGAEVWGFVAPEHFGKLRRLRENIPLIGSASKKPYFFDGGIGVYTRDVNQDGKLLRADGDQVLLFASMRRGGRYIYALDASDPLDPRLLWKRGCPNADDNAGCDTGFAELGETWSKPEVTFLRAFGNRPVLVFSAGYDAAVEDVQPCLATAATAADVTSVTGGTVTYTSTGTCTVSGGTGTTVARTKGRGLFIVDAYSGDLLWRAGPDPSANAFVPEMSFSVAADAVVLNRDRDLSRPSLGTENVPGGYGDRIYAADTGGNLWRVDVDSATPSDWVVTKLAAIADLASPAGRRKFLNAPDVVYGRDANGPYDAVLIGSGDREHPFDATVENRFYMFKDRRVGLDASGQATITEMDLYDATSNCLQTCTDPILSSAQASLLAASGWMMRLGAGEKVVGGATTISGAVFFNTNQPSTNTPCASNLGIAREYIVSYKDATAMPYLAVGSAYTIATRSSVHAGGGFLPTPVPVTVRISGRNYQGVISGPSVREGNPLPLGTRLRTYWFRKME